MTIQQFIEKAKRGGWNDAPYRSWYQMLLEPEAWRAVGEVQGWSEHETDDYYSPYDGEPMAINNMHRMIDALAEGKTIEEFLATL